MKVLFISSGNKLTGISTIVRNQGESISKLGVEVEYFRILGKGFTNYLKNIKRLHDFLKVNSYDLVHAHYSFSGYVAAIAGAKPLVVSLMGSDVNLKKVSKLIIKWFDFLFWKACIVKSIDMKDKLAIKDANVVPNGVEFDRFKPMDKEKAQKELGWNHKKKNILFAADKNRYEKNFKLAKSAFDLVEFQNKELHILNNISYEMMPKYYNASDVVLLTSLWEGSPNVIKEAAACNRPIVVTDVGDVRNTIGQIEGCFVTSNSPKEIAGSIQAAFNYSSTNARDMIAYLDDMHIAKIITNIYEKIVK